MLLNREVLAVDQAPLGREGDRISQEGSTEVWAKPLAGEAVAVGLFNRANVPQPVSFDPSSAGVPASARIRDLWAGTYLPSLNGKYTAEVPAHGVVLLRLGGVTTVPGK